MSVYIVNVAGYGFNAMAEVEAIDRDDALNKAIEDFTRAKVIQYLPRNIKANSHIILKVPSRTVDSVCGGS